ncbi:unnamed protein product, partial [marine sediment metagenome]
MPKKTVVRKTRSAKSGVKKDFPFTYEMFESISGNGDAPEYVKKFRTDAWKSFTCLPIPTIKEEAWRRTNLRSLPANDFILTEMQNTGTNNLPPVPDELLEPLVGETHGGQIIISPQEVITNENPELSKQGVIFTDLSTAIKQYPEILEHIMGKIVKSDEGKFSA